MKPQFLGLLVAPLGACMIVAGCDGGGREGAPAPAAAPAKAPVEPAAQPAPPSASQSIMRPSVIAESEPEPPEPPEPPAPPKATVLFPSGSALDDAGREVLDGLLGDPAMPAEARFVLRGHADSRGGDRANLATSRRRAEAVQAYLESKGVDPERIEVIALGERRPAAPNATLAGEDDPEGRALNRRVEVEVTPPPEPAAPQDAAPGGEPAAPAPAAPPKP